MSDEEKRELRIKQQEKALRLQANIDTRLKEELTKKRAEKDSDDDDTDTESESEGALKIDESYDENTKNLDKDIAKLSRLDDDRTSSEANKHSEVAHLSQQTFEDMLKEYETTIDRKNNQMIEQTLKINDIDRNKSASKSVKWSDLNSPRSEHDDEDDDDEDEDAEESEDEEEDYVAESEDDLSKENKNHAVTKIIRIKHTESEIIEEKLRNLKFSREKPEVNSPGDIFNVFYKPKSILKQSQTASELGSTEDETKSKNATSQALKSEIKNAEFEQFEPQKVGLFAQVLNYSIRRPQRMWGERE